MTKYDPFHLIFKQARPRNTEEAFALATEHLELTLDELRNALLRKAEKRAVAAEHDLRIGTDEEDHDAVSPV